MHIHANPAIDELDAGIDDAARTELRADLGGTEIGGGVARHGGIGDDVEARHRAQCVDDVALQAPRERAIAGTGKRQHGYGARVDDGRDADIGCDGGVNAFDLGSADRL